MSDIDVREEIVSFLRWEIVGPGLADEVLEETPTRRYSAGILFPGGNHIDEHEDIESEDSVEADIVDSQGDDPAGQDDQRDDEAPSVRRRRTYVGDSVNDDPVYLANALSPAAMGLSFLANPLGGHLRFTVNAAVYSEVSGKRKTWKRQRLEIQQVDVDLRSSNMDGPLIQSKVIYEDLKLYVLSRKRDDGSYLVTASLYNGKITTGDRRKAPARDCYFQAAFEVSSVDSNPVFPEYRLFDVSDQMDSEQLSLELLYRNRKAYAVGHGCAADWDADDGEAATAIRTQVVPSVDVPPVLPRVSDTSAHQMYTLSGRNGECSDDQILEALESVPREYSVWISEVRSGLETIPPSLFETSKKHLESCDECTERIMHGIACLKNDPQLMTAFKWANKAMLMQQIHYARPRRQTKDDSWEDFPNSYMPQQAWQGRWRCFQLAFILMNLSSLVSDGSGGEADPRNIVDLIWFPTGGGKTEAYLGLAACSIFYRRLNNPSSDGCCILTRYTLRLLTSQQFQRAASMICACEILRRENESKLGTSPISIGLWLGGSSSPNKRADSKSRLSDWMRDRGENPYQLISCPWCGTALDNRDKPGYRQKSAASPMQFVCPDRRCAFSSRNSCLPVSVVDEDIYESPPTMIVATVDKFAMLAWNPLSGSILGLGNTKRDAPDLIIQDELHLIAGPLGSMVGLYESVIDLLCRRDGRLPKIVASTATIRRAHEQCRSLYNRDTRVFPPPGIDASDNYFAVEHKTEPARRYVGVFGSSSPSQITTSLRSAAAVLQSVKGLDISNQERDPYWTLVWYFNSIRELGHASTLVEADIPEYLRVIARRLPDLPREKQRRLGRPVELTGRVRADDIPQTLQRLEMKHTEEKPAIDVLLATNMISVGVDVPRLGLMLVAGQPKTTAEYIQASSRVGRSKDAPGLVVTLYSPGKPRDRSHYEHFRAYHESFYRYVEPTSVTPFSLPAMDRALHALLVIASRHVDEIEDVEDFLPEGNSVSLLSSWLSARCASIDPAHTSELTKRINALARCWEDHGPELWGKPYGIPSEDKVSLLYPMACVLPDSVEAIWPTPTSMRNVDVECQGRVLSSYLNHDDDSDQMHADDEEETGNG